MLEELHSVRHLLILLCPLRTSPSGVSCDWLVVSTDAQRVALCVSSRLSSVSTADITLSSAVWLSCCRLFCQGTTGQRQKQYSIYTHAYPKLQFNWMVITGFCLWMSAISFARRSRAQDLCWSDQVQSQVVRIACVSFWFCACWYRLYSNFYSVMKIILSSVICRSYLFSADCTLQWLCTIKWQSGRGCAQSALLIVHRSLTVHIQYGEVIGSAYGAVNSGARNSTLDKCVSLAHKHQLHDGWVEFPSLYPVSSTDTTSVAVWSPVRLLSLVSNWLTLCMVHSLGQTQCNGPGLALSVTSLHQTNYCYAHSKNL